MPQIAVCISGHLRDFDKCWGNIYRNFISALQKAGCDVDYFVSTWDVKGNRETDWTGESGAWSVLQILNPITFTVERFDRSFFIRKYNTNKWQEYSHLSNATTCGDSVSMWYKISSSYKMAVEHENLYGIKYDAIVRLRTDVLFDNPYDITELEDVLNSEVIYVPKWHQKWPEISRTMTDYFAIGSRESMDRYMTVYDNINTLIGEDQCPHTGEGFLSEQIKDLNVKRMNMGFSFQRANHIEKRV